MSFYDILAAAWRFLPVATCGAHLIQPSMTLTWFGSYPKCAPQVYRLKGLDGHFNTAKTVARWEERLAAVGAALGKAYGADARW